MQNLQRGKTRHPPLTIHVSFNHPLFLSTSNATMKAKALTVQWHEDNQPVYSAHFQPSKTNAKWRRIATAGGDNTVRIWALSYKDVDQQDIASVEYLSTLARHSQAVNVVRFDPKGNTLASASDDGTILLWTMDSQVSSSIYHTEHGLEDKETWKLRNICRSSSNSSFEFYDIAWSPDSQFIIAGSIDNIARIYNASNGHCIRQLADHSHYVQGVAWDPLNEYLATQGSDRSVHIYTLRSRDGNFLLDDYKSTRQEVPVKRIGNTPTPSSAASSEQTDASPASEMARISHTRRESMDSPLYSAPSTPQSSTSSMNPPPFPVSQTHSRTSSFSRTTTRRSESPSPAMPLPAVRSKGTLDFHGESLTSFFRRLTFAPDGSLLFTPSGFFRYKDKAANDEETGSTNTVYIYTRAGLNQPPIAHLPGLTKPSIAVNCCPVLFKLREPIKTKQIKLDKEKIEILETDAASKNSVFKLKGDYRIVYAVATQDSVVIYDTQQSTPLCIVSNLHFATFTDLTWCPDGDLLFMTSTDGFCSVIKFENNELGEPYIFTATSSTSSVPIPSSSPFIRPSSSSPAIPAASLAAMSEPPSLIPVISHVPSIVTHGGQSTLWEAAKRPHEKEDSDDIKDKDEKKKRRIAPTLISN